MRVIKTACACIGVMFGCFIGVMPVGAQTPDTAIYGADLCVNGSAGGWTGACRCWDGWSGMHCTEQGTTVCTQNADCNSGFYCLLSQKICYQTLVWPALTVSNKRFFLSKSLMNFEETAGFCAAFNARPATRADFNCAGMGVGCLEDTVLAPLQERALHRGFFWLDAKNEAEAFYADLNDGTVYSQKKTSGAVTQGLCVTGDK